MGGRPAPDRAARRGAADRRRSRSTDPRHARTGREAPTRLRRRASTRGVPRAPTPGSGGGAGDRSRGSGRPGPQPGTAPGAGRCRMTDPGSTMPSSRSRQGGDPMAGPCAQLGEQSPGQRLRVHARFEPRTGAGRTAAVAAARLDEVGRGREQLVVAVPQAFREADPARHRLVQVDGGLLRVRASAPGTPGRGRADRPSGGPTRPSGSPARRPGARRRDRRAASRRGPCRRSASRPSSGARARAGRSGPTRRSRR